MRHERSQTKIVATIGPASAPKEVLRKMFLEGIDVCRLNFSHGTHEEHLKVIQNIRQLNEELRANVAILADLQGPKLRVGKIQDDEMEVKEDDSIVFVTDKNKAKGRKIHMKYQEFPRDVKDGDTILIDDGKIKLQVSDTNGVDTVKAQVVHGGTISSHKGVNLPDTRVSLPSLTEKDMKDAEFALDQDVDWIALSFVRTVTDIADLKKIIKKKNKHAGVIAKIEKPEALNEIDEIIDLSDGIMVARGDLGVEVSFDMIPLIQKDIVAKCINQARPVIIATQMMESMINNFRPTRAEATDVANAVLDGADALMLSGETSIGKYPVEVIRHMQQIVDYTEQKGFVFYREHSSREFNNTFLPDSICANASHLSEKTDASAIITFTHSGYTASRISSQRPKANIFAFTSNKLLLPKLSMIWGVRAYHFKSYENIDDSIEHSIEYLKGEGLIKHGDLVVHVGSTPPYQKGQTNMMKLSNV
jgi:pyruvate kinase